MRFSLSGFFSRRIPKEVWILGLVSMLMDISSEMIHSILPLFMVTSLGMSALAVGLIEGLAEATAQIVKVFSGVLSDYTGKRKGLTVFGYALGAFSKPFFAVTSMGSVVLGARLVDRVGKGVRGAPRDALIADVTPPEVRGEAFGLRQSLDTLGAFIGPLVAAGLMLLLSDNFRAIFWIAFFPALLAVIILFFGIKEPDSEDGKKRDNPIRRENLKRLGGDYWFVVLVGAVFALARFSEAFLVLKADDAGMPLALIPLLIAAMNFVYALCAYPFGRLADRVSHRVLLAAGVAVLIAADLALAFQGHWGGVLAGVLLWGMHLGITQGLLSTMVAATAPADLRGTAFGFFNLVGGVATLLASLVAGWMWSSLGASFTFYAGAVFACAVLILLLISMARAKRVNG